MIKLKCSIKNNFDFFKCIIKINALIVKINAFIIAPKNFDAYYSAFYCQILLLESSEFNNALKQYILFYYTLEYSIALRI